MHCLSIKPLYLYWIFPTFFKPCLQHLLNYIIRLVEYVVHLWIPKFGIQHVIVSEYQKDKILNHLIWIKREYQVTWHVHSMPLKPIKLGFLYFVFFLKIQVIYLSNTYNDMTFKLISNMFNFSYTIFVSFFSRLNIQILRFHNTCLRDWNLFI